MLWRRHPTTHKNGKSSASYHFSLLMWRFKLTHRSTLHILPWATEKSQDAGAALHMLGALRWSYNAQKLNILYSSWKVWCVIYHQGALFQVFASAWRFEMSENRNCLTRKWHIRAWTEPNTDWSACQNAITHWLWHNTHHRHEKGTRATCCWCIWCPHAHTRLKINNFEFFGDSIQFNSKNFNHSTRGNFVLVMAGL